MFLFEFSSFTQGILFFILFVLFKAMRSGSVWFTWLKCSNHFALLLQCSHCLEMFILSFLVSQAFISMLAKRGAVFMHGCIGYHFDGLLIHLLIALHPLVLFIAVWLTSEDAGYDWVGVGVGGRGRWGGGGCNRVYCIHVSGHDPLTFLFCPFSFLIECEFYGPNYLRC